MIILEGFVIRHKSTGRLMPLMKRGRGYSHWNPNEGDKSVYAETNIPRLLTSKRQASKVIDLWFSIQNERVKQYQNPYTGEWDEEYYGTKDSRKKEDLEILAAKLEVIENDRPINPK